MFKRILYMILVLAAIAAAGVVIWRYNTYIYQRAIREALLRYKTEPVKRFTFSQENSLKEWEEKVFRGRVVYMIERDKDLSYVRAESAGTASALYYKIKLDVNHKHPIISWKWKVNTFPKKTKPENIGTEDEHDFAARIYVIFPAGFITNWKVLEYIWAETLPVNLMGDSPYSKNIKLIVLKSGSAKDGGWYQEERDVIADYTKAFGEPPGHDIGAVSFMTNAEHTGTSADADYDDIKLGYLEDAMKTSQGGDHGK